MWRFPSPKIYLTFSAFQSNITQSFRRLSKSRDRVVDKWGYFADYDIYTLSTYKKLFRSGSVNFSHTDKNQGIVGKIDRAHRSANDYSHFTKRFKWNSVEICKAWTGCQKWGYYERNVSSFIRTKWRFLHGCDWSVSCNLRLEQKLAFYDRARFCGSSKLQFMNRKVSAHDYTEHKNFQMLF